MIQTALIGLGRIGWQFHLPEIQKHRQYSLLAVVDVDGARMEEASAVYGMRGYTSVEEMLEKEKLLAAHRAGIDTVCIPKENEKDLAELPENVRAALTIVLAEDVHTVLETALCGEPHAKKTKETAQKE